MFLSVTHPLIWVEMVIRTAQSPPADDVISTWVPLVALGVSVTGAMHCGPDAA